MSDQPQTPVQFNPELVRCVEPGRTDAGAWHRAVDVARELLARGIWSGEKTLCIRDAYNVHNALLGIHRDEAPSFETVHIGGEMYIRLCDTEASTDPTTSHLDQLALAEDDRDAAKPPDYFDEHGERPLTVGADPRVRPDAEPPLDDDDTEPIPIDALTHAAEEADSTYSVGDVLQYEHKTIEIFGITLDGLYVIREDGHVDASVQYTAEQLDNFMRTGSLYIQRHDDLDDWIAWQKAHDPREFAIDFDTGAGDLRERELDGWLAVHYQFVPVASGRMTLNVIWKRERR